MSLVPCLLGALDVVGTQSALGVLSVLCALCVLVVANALGGYPCVVGAQVIFNARRMRTRVAVLTLSVCLSVCVTDLLTA